MLVFYPEFDVPDVEDVDVVLLIDLSNSMKGKAAVQAKQLACLFIQKLPESAIFNVVTFGSSYVEAFPQSVLANNNNRNLAEKFVQVNEKNRGVKIISKYYVQRKRAVVL